MPGPERTLEAWCVGEAHRRGALLLKWEGAKGVPDRILIRPNIVYAKGLTYTFGAAITFVEFKAPGKKPTPIQTAMHAKLQEHGAHVEIIDSREDFVSLLG